MARKYRVRTKCQSCGEVYTTRAKKDRSPATYCKYCGSKRTRSLKSHPVIPKK